MCLVYFYFGTEIHYHSRLSFIIIACIEKNNFSGPLVCRKIDSGRVRRNYVADSQKRKEKKRKRKASTENTSQLFSLNPLVRGEGAKTEKTRGAPT